jgi:hypothetical protein
MMLANDEINCEKEILKILMQIVCFPDFHYAFSLVDLL